MEDNRAGNKKLLVAKSNKWYEEIYGWVWYIPKYEELYKSTSRKTNS